MNVIEKKWGDIIEYLLQKFDIPQIAFETWIKPLQIQGVKGQILYLKVKDDLWAAYLEKRYKIPLQISIEEITGEMVDITFSQKESMDIHRWKNLGENEKYTFKTFVVGDNNKFAYRTSYEVAKSPGNFYNPLFIYGPAGLGKTHLLYSIYNFIKKHSPQKKILYTTSEMFTNELIEILRNGQKGFTMDTFREKYRTLDILLIDDIQFIIGKESTQEEFFHTFNYLHMAGKQIVISSDRAPKEMEALAARMKTRFEWGLLVPVSAPEYETRVKILQEKIRQECGKELYLGNEIIEYIAQNVFQNIRSLEGALMKMIAWCKLTQCKSLSDVAVAQEILVDIISGNTGKEISAERILEYVSEQYSICIDDIKSKKRSAEIVRLRQVSMFLIRKLTDLPLEAIGKMVGGRNYTTVKYGIDKIAKAMKEDKELAYNIGVLEKKLGKS